MFEERLKQVREARGLTIKEVADALGIPYTTYNNYEKNTREPNGSLLCRIADFYHVSLDYLLGRQGGDTPPTPYIPLSGGTNQRIDEVEVIRLWKSLDDYGKRLVWLVLEEEVRRSGSINGTPTKELENDSNYHHR